MARPAYTNIPDGDVDVDSPLDTDLFTALRDNDESLRIQVVPVNISELSETSATYPGSPNTSFRLYLPDLADYTGIQRLLVFEAEVKVSGGGTATFKVTDNAAAVDSTETTTTSSTYEPKTVTLNFAAGLVDTVRTIDVFMKTTAGTFNLRSVDSITSRLEY